MALKVKGVVDGGVQRDEALDRAWGLAARLLPFASPERLVRDFGPVVLAPALFMVRRQANLTKRGPRGAQFVGGNPGRGKPCFLSSVRISLPAAALSRRRWMKTSSTSPSSLTALHMWYLYWPR